MASGDNWARELRGKGARGPESAPGPRAAPAHRAPARKGGLKAFLAKGRAQAKKKNAESEDSPLGGIEGVASHEHDGRIGEHTRTAGIEKTWGEVEKRGLYYGDDVANLTVGKVSGTFKSGVEYDFDEGTGSIAAIKLEGSAAVLEAKAEKTVARGLLKGEAKVEALQVAGTVDLLSFSRDKKGKVEATLADLGVEANLIRGEIGGEVALTPRTVYDNLIGPFVGLFTGKKETLSKDAKWADHGLVVGGSAEAGIGAAAKATAKIADGKLKLGAKAGAGPMAGLSLSMGLK